MQLCVGCHIPGSGVFAPEQGQLAFPGPERDSLWNAEAQKLVGYWQRQEAIPWVRVHELPAHATFPHMSHVRVGLQCQTCHGPVQEMEKVYRFSSLQMGWCVNCHRGELPLSEAELASVQDRSTFVRRLASL
ncbi:MAG TPA: cytochrome c3 family protein, partial [Longimicrobiaceae bacterium]|nr:cytochrome c3 family protein [Longimicrobiaceae bacterium]